MVVQNLGAHTQTIVDHELDASQHTDEEEIHEVEDGGGIYVAFFVALSPGGKLDQIRAWHGPGESLSSFHFSVTRVPVTLEGGNIPAFDVPVRVLPSMVTSNLRYKRIGLVIDSCQVSRVPWRIGLIIGRVSASFFATPTTTPSFSLSSRTADCAPTGVEMRMFQVPVSDMCSSSRSLPRPSQVGVTW